MIGLKKKLFFTSNMKTHMITIIEPFFYASAPCGSALLATKDLQILTSPNFPQMHLENQRCLWSITSQSNFVIEITVSNVTNESCCSNLQVLQVIS